MTSSSFTGQTRKSFVLIKLWRLKILSKERIMPLFSFLVRIWVAIAIHKVFAGASKNAILRYSRLTSVHNLQKDLVMFNQFLNDSLKDRTGTQANYEKFLSGNILLQPSCNLVNLVKLRSVFRAFSPTLPQSLPPLLVNDCAAVVVQARAKNFGITPRRRNALYDICVNGQLGLISSS